MQKKFLYMLAAGHLCVDINSGSLPAILPFFVYNYGMDYKEIAGLMFASSFLSSVIQPLFGHLADKGSRQWFIILGLLMSGLSLTVTGFITEYWMIFGAVTLMGIGGSIFHPEAARLVNRVSGNRRGSGMSIFSVGGNAGFGLGPLLAVALISYFGMAGTMFYGVSCVVMGLVMCFLLPQLKRGAEAMESASAKRASGDDNLLENDWNGFGRLSVLILFRSTVFCGLRSFLPLFCIQALGATHAIGSATLSIFSIAGVGSTLLGGYLTDRWGCVKVLRLGSCLMVPMLAIAVLTQNIYVVYAMLIPLSMTMQGPYSAMVVLGQTYLSKSVGFASGVTLGLSFSLGGIIAPSLGWFADINGINAVMVLLIGVAVLCAISSAFLKKPNESRS